MAVDSKLIERSLHRALERNPNLVTDFYGVLFHRHPTIRWMFQRKLRNVQEQMFKDALRYAVLNLKNTQTLREMLGELGAKHATYGVTDEMYDWVGEALLRALADAIGDEWTPALAAAWGEAYGAVAALMRAGPSLYDD